MGLDPQGLYRPENEHDACGVGFVASIKGRKSHTIVEQGLTVLRNLTHRGAVGWDPKLSDGAGLLIQIPDRFYREEMAKQGVKLPPAGQYGVGMVFLPRDPASRIACEYEIERAIKDEGQVLLGWRDVPVDNSDLAQPAIQLEPVIGQVFIGRGRRVTVTDALERKLYIIRKSSGHAIQALKLKHAKQFYVPSMSARTVCYKGMLLANQVGEYYLDLKDARVESALALVHQRFSTNTFPSWDLAHPFRLICHNGEINTLRGNVNWIRARQGAISSPVLGRDLEKIWPLIYDGQSDSASFACALGLLVVGGYSGARAMMMMIPEAWENHTLMDPTRRAFYEYHAAMMEPWDGPASIAFTDGRQIGATLDRNGLRPSRYIVTADDLVIMGSECGCLPVPEERIVKKWRLQPGKMFLVDLEKGRIVDDKELKEGLASARPYAEWIERIRVKLDEVESDKTTPIKSKVRLLDRQQAFAYTKEDLKFIMQPMSAAGEEPVGSMGNDSPLAVISNKNKTLYNYFKQLFAQVTNPAIDPIREELVMSLVSFIGPKPNLLGIDELNPPLRLEVSQPVLDFYEMEKIRHIERYTSGKFKSCELDITYPVAWGKDAVEARLASLAAQAEDAVRSGYSIIVISDRLVDRERVAIPALLALSAIHQHLVGKGLRTSTGLVVETGSAREVHHFALLGGYGAEAVHPYLALETVLALNPSAGSKAVKNYATLTNDQARRHMTFRGLFEFRFGECKPVPIEEVEPAAEIVKRFSTGAMSLGSISTEAHTTLAIAMNRIGGKSNTGEGGEDASRFKPLPNGDSMRSAIKQVASGRFGVTTEYLVNSDVLQIKMAQGAKPGEGGQLPGRKVDKTIARVRYSTPGVGLISPPPHHDIYSIEDLAQLIHDLKNANPKAAISVKLVSEVGVGTVAAGVSKARADHVTIAGYEGGTGASPLTSLTHAGSPWEIGLAETQQTLVRNGLRGRIAVQVDGGVRTGRDVVIGAMLGADEFGFATAPLIAAGCIMMRKCPLNTCPVGIATQDPVLRKRFTGQPEHVINYFFFVAEEVRELMAQLGFRSFDEMVGRVDRLDMVPAVNHWKAKGIDLSRLLYQELGQPGVAIYNCERQNHHLDKALDNELIAEAEPALVRKEPVRIEKPIRNVNRTVGAMLSGEVAKRYGHAGLPEDTIWARFDGNAGGSFGAFLAHGITLELYGDANDYVGKGLSGGRLIVRQPKEAKREPTENIIIGNTVLYGAIAGEAYFEGVAGERFAVRNSGAVAVIEGTGDHGCEYMTGGVVVVLGETGRNFAAGMSGGIRSEEHTSELQS